MYTGTVSGVLCREVYCLYCVLIWESPLLEVSYNIFITIKTSSYCKSTNGMGKKYVLRFRSIVHKFVPSR